MARKWNLVVFATLGLVLMTGAAQAQKPEVATPRVYRLHCGYLKFDDIAPFSDTGEFDNVPSEMSDTCILVGHAKGWLLWDTGLDKSKLNNPQRDDAWKLTLGLDATIEQQLRKIGLEPGDITHVTFSHTHFDHTGQTNDFKNAVLIWQAKEKAFATDKNAPPVIDQSSFSYHTQHAKELIVNGDHDVFGDGTVRLLTANGHTPGHQVLLVKLKSGNWIFSGDLFHQTESREKRLVPTFNYSRAETESSINRIEKLIERHKASLVIQHEKADIDKLPKFPEFLQ